MEYIKNHKKEFIISLLVLVVLVVAGFVFGGRHSKNVKSPSSSEAVIFDPLSVTEQPRIMRGSKKSTVAAVAEMSYTEAFMKYKDGHVLQFDERCQAFPKTMSIANNSTVMLDNRSNNDEVIKIGESAYPVPAYGFKIINLAIDKIPAVFTIDCLKSQNVNTLIVE